MSQVLSVLHSKGKISDDMVAMAKKFVQENQYPADPVQSKPVLPVVSNRSGW